MEKSLLKAALTSTVAARATKPKVAMPARRAVSPRRSERGPFSTRDKAPAKKLYPLRAKASRSAKLPICDMGNPHVSFQKRRTEATARAGSSYTRGLFAQKLGARGINSRLRECNKLRRSAVDCPGGQPLHARL